MTLLSPHWRFKPCASGRLFAGALAACVLVMGCRNNVADEDQEARASTKKWQVAGLQIEGRAGPDWEWFSYLPLRSGNSGPAQFVAPARLAKEVENILSSHDQAPGLVILVAPDPCKSTQAKPNCRDRRRMLDRVDAATQHPTPVHCTSRDSQTCLVSTVRLESVTESAAASTCPSAKDEACLYAVGLDRSGRVWVVCHTGTVELSAATDASRARSLSCHSKYMHFRLLPGVTI